MMKKNPFWLAIVSFIGVIVLWYTISLVLELNDYYSRKARTSPSTLTWSTEGKASDRYVLSGTYQYAVNGQLHEGTTTLKKPVLRNPTAAKMAKERVSQDTWQVYYSPKNPNSSSLQRNFPLKSCIYVAILWGILLYFIWIGTIGYQFFAKD